MRYRFVERERANHSIVMLCRVLRVSCSGFHAWHKREPSARAREDAVLTERILRIHAQSRQTYGAPRVHAELAAAGIRCGTKRVARLMRTVGVVGCHRRRHVVTTVREASASPAPDHLQRQFVAETPNSRWTADITYVPTWSGFLYLAVVLDVFSRRIVGWANVPGTGMADHLRTELVLSALEMALWTRRPDRGVIHHSDQCARNGYGCQYTSLAFGTRCQQAGVVPSLGSRGDCFDNAITESFFATLECELLDRHVFRTHSQARTAIFDYLEGFYNTHRRHSALGYLSPAAFERQFTEEIAA